MWLLQQSKASTNSNKQATEKQELEGIWQQQQQLATNKKGWWTLFASCLLLFSSESSSHDENQQQQQHLHENKDLEAYQDSLSFVCHVDTGAADLVAGS